MIEAELKAPEELFPLPKLPSWSQMLDHLTGTAPITPQPPARKSRKVTFDTDEDDDLAG